MKTFLFLILLSIISLTSIYSQNVRPVKTYSEPLILDIKDSLLISMIDFQIHKKDTCEKSGRRAEYLYILQIEGHTADFLFVIGIACMPPSILENERNIGIIRFNGSVYVIRGEEYYHFFDKTDKKDLVLYNKYYWKDRSGCLCEAFAPEEFCEWDFTYKNGKLTLVNTENTKSVD